MRRLVDLLWFVAVLAYGVWFVRECVPSEWLDARPFGP